MQVTNIRVSFSRKKQPVQYEEIAPAVEFSAVLDDDECYVKATRTLLYNAAEAVYAGIGYNIPEKIATALRNGDSLNGTVTTHTVAHDPTVQSTPTEAVEGDLYTQEDIDAHGVEDKPTEEKPKARGRPRGSKNTAPKKTKVDKEAEASDEIPEDAPNIRTSPEDRVDPADTDGIPGDDSVPVTQEPLPSGETEVAEQPADEYTAKDLHDFVRSAVSKKEVSVANAKQIQAHFRVKRLRDLSSEQAVEGRDMLLKMMEVA